MEDLKELVKIYLSRRMGQMETFCPEDVNHKCLPYRLFEGVKNQRFNNEGEAHALIIHIDII